MGATGRHSGGAGHWTAVDPQGNRLDAARALPGGADGPFPLRSEPDPGYPAEAPVDVMVIFSVIRRRNRLILALALGMILLAAPFILMMQRSYFAELRLLLHRSPSSELATPGAEPLGALNLTTELERLLAQANVRQVVEDLDLASRAEFKPTASAEDPMDDVIHKFYSGLRIRRDDQTNVVQIGFNSLDPLLAAQVPNALVKVYLTKREQMLQAQVAEAKGWIETQINTARKAIASAEAAETAYRVGHGPLSSEFQMATVYQFSALEGRQFAISQSRSDLTARMARLNSGRLEAGKAQDGSLSTSLQRDLQTSQRELARLLATYGENYAGVSAAREMIVEAQAAIDRELAAQLESAQSDMAALDTESAAIEAQLAAQRESLSRMGIAQAEIAVMEQGIEAQRSKLQSLEDQLRTLATGASLPLAEVELLSPSSVPNGPTGYGRKVYMALVIAAAFGIAVTVACVLELMDRSIRSQQQLRGLHGVRPAGLVPHLPFRRGALLGAELALQKNGAFGDAIGWLMLMLRQQGLGAASGPGGILVTSAMPKEGKSFMSAALAQALQASGHPVLLVDCDLRRGQVHRMFAATTTASAPATGSMAPGLGELLSGTVTTEAVVQIDAVTAVSFISRGTPQADFDWERMTELARYAADTGRILLLDAAPVLAASETVDLCRFAPRRLLVTRWGKTSRRAVELAMDRLKVECAGDIFVVINDVDPVQHSRYRFEDSDIFSPELSVYHAPATAQPAR